MAAPPRKPPDGQLPQGLPRGKKSDKSTAVSPARREAFAILLEVEQGRSHSDDLLRRSRVSALSAPDRHLCTALVLGTLRWQIRLDALIQPLLARPNVRLDSEIRIALRLGAFQLLFLDRVPAHAAIGESVELAKLAGHKFASGMVNAVLRKLSRQPKPSTDMPDSLTAAELAESTAHPAWLVERWVRHYGLSAAKDLCLHGQQQPVLAIRVDSQQTGDALEAGGMRLEPGVLLISARVVNSGEIAVLVVQDESRVRMQEEASQLIAELAGSPTARRIWDCCAAPGGKTLILAERNPGAKIVATELSPVRLKALRERIAAIGDPELNGRIEVLQVDASTFEANVEAQGNFDVVLADVPCSGTGTLGRNPEIRHRLQPDDLARHHQRQCAILQAALRACKPEASRVFYSTCSVEPEENEAVVAEVLAASPGWRQVSLTGRIQELIAEVRVTPFGAEYLLTSVGEDGALRLFPGKLATDGFFVALLERSN